MATRSEPAVALAHEQAAAVHGAYRWWSTASSLSPAPGRPGCERPRARLLLDEASLQHAWHARLWADRLPVLDGVDPDRFTVAPAGCDALFAELADLGDRSGDAPALVAGLSGLYDVVVPALLTSYGHHRRIATEVTDRPTERALGLAASDDAALCAAARRLLDDLAAAPELAARRAASSERLVSLLPARRPARRSSPCPRAGWPGLSRRPAHRIMTARPGWSDRPLDSVR